MGDNNATSKHYTGTKVISRVFVIDGVVFSWWSIGESPAHVTVSNELFGNKSGFANGDREEVAKTLAGEMLRTHLPWLR